MINFIAISNEIFLDFNVMYKFVIMGIGRETLWDFDNTGEGLIMFNQKEVFNTLMNEVNSELKIAPKYRLYSDEWFNNALQKAGIYFVWKESELMYVGETSNIKKRMSDLKKHSITHLEEK